MAVDCVLGVLWLAILSSAAVVARPCSPELSEGFYNQENCIPMSPEREAEIQDIVSEISNFADDLALDHDYFDIRLMKFAIEKHSPNEPEDKNVEIQVTVNDCAGEGKSNTEAGSKTNAGDEANKGTSTELAHSDTAVSSPAHPELLHLNLDEAGQQLLQRIEEIRGRKKPFIALLLGDEYVFV